ncbi:MAG TPA: SDR family oxidoreductase [Bryobacteraceae bacterium]|jgi:NAD(P)-dependent dehydrogenase (short-subunit alcohol dehydrogenase family)
MNGKVVLVTGASRGIGAATAIKLAERGLNVVLNYRGKTARAEEVAARIRELGQKALLAQADLTVSTEIEAMIQLVREKFTRLDVLILNASGGLEKDKAEDYAMALNFTAQLETAQLAAALMPAGGRIVFITSHWAHFYGEKPVMPAYEPVAKSKKAGEEALRQYALELNAKDISLLVVSGDAIEGTITPRLLNRMSPGVMASRQGTLPSVDEFAAAISAAALDDSLPSGHTVFVGSTDY